MEKSEHPCLSCAFVLARIGGSCLSATRVIICPYCHHRAGSLHLSSCSRPEDMRKAFCITCHLWFPYIGKGSLQAYSEIWRNNECKP